MVHGEKDSGRACPGSGRKRSTIHVVLPAFNEGRNIGRLLDRIASVMGEEGLHYRVVVVDDGSTDDTVDR
jgi:dolichol-phosphate mannosyltransferase